MMNLHEQYTYSIWPMDWNDDFIDWTISLKSDLFKAQFKYDDILSILCGPNL